MDKHWELRYVLHIHPQIQQVLVSQKRWCSKTLQCTASTNSFARTCFVHLFVPKINYSPRKRRTECHATRNTHRKSFKITCHVPVNRRSGSSPICLCWVRIVHWMRVQFRLDGVNSEWNSCKSMISSVSTLYSLQRTNIHTCPSCRFGNLKRYCVHKTVAPLLTLSCASQWNALRA